MKKFLVVSIVVVGVLIIAVGPAFGQKAPKVKWRRFEPVGTRYWDLTAPASPEFSVMDYTTGCFIPPQDDGFPPQWQYKWDCPCDACVVPK